MRCDLYRACLPTPSSFRNSTRSWDTWDEQHIHLFDTTSPPTDKHLSIPLQPTSLHLNRRPTSSSPRSSSTILPAPGAIDFAMAHRRGPWSPAEDAYLVQLVHTQGALNWVRIAQLIGSRSPKQCRERYHQNLKPSLNHEPISPEEGLLIERLVGEMGKRWAEIARRLNGRSDNAVKNWWNGSMNRRRRLILRRRTSSHGAHPYAEHDQSPAHPRPASMPSHHLAASEPTYRPTGAPDEALPSPAESEVSRAESVDRAPSLISDNGSNLSTSPRAVPSPTFELPPLHKIAQSDVRRPSLPALLHRPTPVFSDSDNAFPARFPSDNKVHTLNTLSPITYGRAEYAHAPIPPSPREYHYEAKAQLPTAPPTPIQLPPLHLTAAPEQQVDRDVRMNLSSLLG